VNKNHLAFQSKIKQHPKVETTRVLGTIFLEIKIEAQPVTTEAGNKLYDFF
jgi:adenosylmethionine-8-amino-7-oxononanoate aminotransferase